MYHKGVIARMFDPVLSEVLGGSGVGNSGICGGSGGTRGTFAGFIGRGGGSGSSCSIGGG